MDYSNDRRKLRSMLVDKGDPPCYFEEKAMKQGIYPLNTRAPEQSVCRFVRFLLFFSLSMALTFTFSCASVSEYSRFFKYGTVVSDMDLSPRNGTPSLSNESPAILLKKGYIPIGSFEVKHPAGVETAMTTKEEALSLAADHGADLVVLSSDNELRDDVITKKGECLEMRSYPEVGWEPSGGAFGELRTVRECSKWAEVSERTKVIITKGAAWRKEPDLVRRAGNAMLIEAINERDQDTVIELVKSGLVDVNTRDRFGWTPLMILAIDDHPDSTEIASFLVKNGAQLDLKDPEGRTALMLSGMKANVAMFRLLIRLKADPAVTDHHGKTALDLVPASKKKEFEDYIRKR